MPDSVVSQLSYFLEHGVSTHGVTDFAIPLGTAHPTLAELLKKNDYHGASFIGAVILDIKTLAPGLGRGFVMTTAPI